VEQVEKTISEYRQQQQSRRGRRAIRIVLLIYVGAQVLLGTGLAIFVLWR
jgi:hypothetical protein